MDPDRLDGLLDGEELLALLSVRFSAGTQTHVDDEQPGMIRTGVAQRFAFSRWTQKAAAVGFPVAGPEMVIGVTPQRLLVWRPGLLRTRPKHFAGALPLSDIRRVGVHRRVVATVLTLLFEDGTIVAVETLRAGRLRGLAETIPTYPDYRAR